VVLSDRSIKEEIDKGRITIRPFDYSCVQPASVDVHLDKTFRVFHHWQSPHYIDLTQELDGITEEVKIPAGHNFSLQPGHFVLGSTMEYVALPDDIMGRLEGKSSLGRIGLLIHSTAGYVDPGWKGHLTLELYNVCALPIILMPGMKISQISFHRLTTPAERPYGSPGLGSKYLEQEGPTQTRYFQEYTRLPLLSMPSIPMKDRCKGETGVAMDLRGWLRESEFRGSVKRFAEGLGIPLKTVEDWFYRDAMPTSVNRKKLFTLTKLQMFGPVGYHVEPDQPQRSLPLSVPPFK
jgi:dCTP deaminase